MIACIIMYFLANATFTALTTKSYQEYTYYQFGKNPPKSWLAFYIFINLLIGIPYFVLFVIWNKHNDE
jgi:hypothetical protein